MSVWTVHIRLDGFIAVWQLACCMYAFSIVPCNEIIAWSLCKYFNIFAGFLQIGENWKKRNFCGQGKSWKDQGKILF